MYLLPAIRINRAISATLLYPEHPIQAIAASECISVFSPFLNPKMYSRIFSIILAFMYFPSYTTLYLKYFEKQNLKHYQAEIILLILFIFTYGIQNFDNINYFN